MLCSLGLLDDPLLTRLPALLRFTRCLLFGWTLTATNTAKEIHPTA